MRSMLGLLVGRVIALLTYKHIFKHECGWHRCATPMQTIDMVGAENDLPWA